MTGLGLGTEVDTSLEIALEALFDEEQACESVQHLTHPKDHAGAAEWYVHVKHECGYDVVRAFCDRIKRVLDKPYTLTNCTGCGARLVASEIIQSTTRIGSDG